ncbi:hypothetical protein BDV96DRAFT_613017 [Lophiotrema nucula]|uniref:GYF domain-containing protein n=1 Tax=Lophiotrema nucula TaxID=690887 RepID=A0A6A5Z7L2_9PLEO|nr:hypothetical protein BDV96DRAFT_613017 [Lophiotrema nucula]
MANPSNPARPKRPGDLFTRTHHLDSDEPSSKKPRFDPRNPSTLVPDAEEDDPILDADEIGKRGGIKRNAVNIDGYDSDSSTENFDARADAKSKGDAAKPKKDEDEDDMFAEEEDDEEDGDDLLRRGDKKKPSVRFLEDHEIEGQEDASKAGGHVAVAFGKGKGAVTEDAESSSESGGDEERDRLDSDVDEEVGAGGKKKHAPKLDAFNMRQEQEDGRFDEAGNYVRKAYDPDAAQDSWLDGISKKDIKRAREAHDMQEEERKNRERQEDSIMTGDVLAALIINLQKGETPFEALPRYDKMKLKKPMKGSSKNKKNQHMDVDEDPVKQAADSKAKEAIKSITEAASRLETRGFENIYSEPRELIVRLYKRETGEDWKDPPKQWEFRWTGAPDEIHGPYDTRTMDAWEDAGHFAAGAEFRIVGDLDWTDLADFD